jgi:hypothetical protein
MSQRAVILKMMLMGVLHQRALVERTKICNNSVLSLLSALRAEGIVEGDVQHGYKIIDLVRARYLADGGKLGEMPLPREIPFDDLGDAWPEPGFKREAHG